MLAMLAVVLATVSSPTPSPTISPLPSAVVEWYAARGAAASGLDTELVRAVIDAESGGDPTAVSAAGAVGLMQLMPQTAKDCGIDDRFDALANVRCGAMTLDDLVRRYGVEIGIAAYNDGAGNVASVGDHFSKTPLETQRYVRDIIDEYDALQHEAIAQRPPSSDASPRAEIAVALPTAQSAFPGCDPEETLAVL